MWGTLLPVLTGGILALVGVAVGPLANDWIAARRAAESETKNNFEALFKILDEHVEWIEHKRMAMWDSRPVTYRAPVHRAIAICAMRFPGLVDDFDALKKETINFEVWIANSAARKAEGKIKEVNDGLSEAYPPLVAAINNAEAKLIAYARNELSVKKS